MYKLEIIQSETLTRQLNQNWQLGDWAVNGYKWYKTVSDFTSKIIDSVQKM